MRDHRTYVRNLGSCGNKPEKNSVTSLQNDKAKTKNAKERLAPMQSIKLRFSVA